MDNGDGNDFRTRILTLLPPGWFADDSPVLNGALTACAKSLSWCYALYLYARTQTRLSTASDGWLDMAACDFFGNGLQRPGEMNDEQFRQQIKVSLFRERGTRQAITLILEEMTGNTPVIFEPQRPLDTGAYGTPGTGYGVTGGYGSLLIPHQAFVVLNRPRRAGIPRVAGYQITTAGYGCPSQGEYVSRQMIAGRITDAQIYEAVATVKMEGTVVWVRLQ